MAYNPYYPIYTPQMPSVPAGQLEQLRAAQMYPQIQTPVQSQQATQQGGGILWVQGEEAAKAYMVAPGASVMLMDSERQAFYIKSADSSGMPTPLRIFDYTERGTQQVSTKTTEGEIYATKQELEEIRKLIDDLTAPEKA